MKTVPAFPRVELGPLALVLFVLAGCVGPSSSTSGDARQAAAGTVIARFAATSPDREMMTIFCSLHPVAAGTEIMPAMHRDGPATPPPVHRAPKESWFFVVDHATPAGFAHRLTYVFVPTDGSAWVESEELWWPKAGGASLWFRGGIMSAPPEYIVFEGIVATAWRLNSSSP